MYLRSSNAWTNLGLGDVCLCTRGGEEVFLLVDFRKLSTH